MDYLTFDLTLSFGFKLLPMASPGSHAGEVWHDRNVRCDDLFIRLSLHKNWKLFRQNEILTTGRCRRWQMSFYIGKKHRQLKSRIFRDSPRCAFTTIKRDDGWFYGLRKIFRLEILTLTLNLGFFVITLDEDMDRDVDEAPKRYTSIARWVVGMGRRLFVRVSEKPRIKVGN